MDHSVQSVYSDPGRWAGLFGAFEPSIEVASAVARNLVAHYRAQAAELPESSREDISLRWVEAIIETDQRRQAMPLSVDRPVGDRVQGCCRDHSLISVAFLRHHTIPARNRVGFATYLSPTTWNHDHVIVEAWLDGRWRRFDPEFAALPAAPPELTDISAGPKSSFLTAAHVWRAHRAGLIDVTRFGVAEGLGIDGAWFVHSYVIAEVAHRFGDELLLWDTWGAMSADLDNAPAEHLVLVDEVAELLVRADGGDQGAESDLLGRYREDSRLHPGRHVRSISPYGVTYDVDLVARATRPATEAPTP